jgi:EAL domain-containing protein (putative c-di-GMP-specific phosphodiesterase class I)
MIGRPIFKHLHVPSGASGGGTIPFEMQPIMRLADGSVTAYELLYRGQRPADWMAVDTAVIQFLIQDQTGLGPVYVNLSDDVLMAHGVELFAQAASANDVTFELSESVSGYCERKAIAAKVNQLIDAGVRVALDDFGAGRDGLERLYSVRKVAAVKIDREFLMTCMRRPDACHLLCMMVANWRREGVRSIAEGVENAAIFEFAQQITVDEVQGWYVDSLVGMGLIAAGN